VLEEAEPAAAGSQSVPDGDSAAGSQLRGATRLPGPD
jgi:hypothetical protein